MASSRIAKELDSAALLAVELEYAEVKASRPPGSTGEVHVDPDATWVVHPGPAWANAGIALRFTPETVEGRLDQILARYRENGRGTGFWVSPFATPADLEARLKARGLLCRKRFPGMACDLSVLPSAPSVPGLTLAEVEDYSLFERHPHPFYGPMRSPIRRAVLASMVRNAAVRPRRSWDFIGLREGVPVGFVSIFLGEQGEGKSNAAGLHDVGVVPVARRQGVGAALVHHACAFAWEQGYRLAVLIASGMGERVYARAGFREVGRIAYWYRSPHR